MYSELGKEVVRRIKKSDMLNNEWYSLRSLLGYDWAVIYFILGARECGKSYAVTDFYVRQFKTKNRPFYWLRLTEASQRKLLQNNAEKLVDPDLRRKYDLDLKVKGENVYNVKRDKKGNIKEKQLMARVLALSTFYNDKGSGLFDKDFLNDPDMYYNICLDEMNREKNERKSFDIVYAFVNQIENLVRSTKNRMRIICIGNTLEEASDLLIPFNFIPEDYGRYFLKSKRCIIDYIAPSEKYLERRKGTVADIMTPDESTFTNEIKIDKTLVSSERLLKPLYGIFFTKAKSDWFTVWEGQNGSSIIALSQREVEQSGFDVIAMRPYLDKFFDKDRREQVLAVFAARAYKYKNLMTFKRFQKELELLKPQG